MAAKGQPKTGGRKKGTPNKATADLKAIASEYTEEAIDRLVLMMRDPKHPNQFGAIKELLDRGHGKAPQAVTGPDGGPLMVQTVRYSDEDQTSE